MQPSVKYLVVIALFAMTSHSSIVRASNDVLPYYFSNQHPFIQIFGLPRAQAHQFMEKDSTLTITTLDVVNNTVQGKNDTESFILDGETYRFNIAFKYGISDKYNLNIELPLVKHSTGRFDNFIRNWHDFFGLTNQEQMQFEPNQLHYAYSKNGNQIIDIKQNQQGIGDIGLAIIYNAHGEQSSENVLYRLHLKLPTGNADKLMGSGGVDIGVSATSQRPNYFKEYYSGVYGQVGILWLGNSDLFANDQRQFVTFGSATIDWDYWRPIIFKAQLDVHSSFYKSDINHLGGNSIQLTVGGSIDLGKQSHIDIGVTENLMTDATPDIGLNISYWFDFD